MPTKTSTKAHSTPAKASRPVAADAKTKSRASDVSPDAIQLLMDDHKAVKKLFKAYEDLVKNSADSDDKQQVAQQICAMLKVHATIEEEIFYPAAREALKEQDLVDEATVEHACAKELISQIETMDPEEALFDAKVTVLGEYIDHHVKEEETEMFPKAKRAKLNLQDLGDDMSARKDELMAEIEDQSVH